MQNAQKIPLSRSLSLFARNSAQTELAQLGQALPGHVVDIFGGIVTINFDVIGITLPQVRMPVATSKNVLPAIAVGDRGVAISASVYIGGVSGLGNGNGDSTQPANLAAMIWIPVSNASWSMGPSTVIEDSTGASKVTVAAAGTTVTGKLSTTGALSAGNGATGSFAITGGTVTVVNGIITSIT